MRMTELADQPIQSTSWFITRADARLQLNDETRAVIARIEASLELAQRQSHAQRLIEQLLHLPVDTPTLIAGYAFFAVSEGDLQPSDLGDGDAVELIGALIRLTSADVAAASSALLQVRRNQRQPDNVRRMLVAMIDDPRVLVLKMAERLVRLHPQHFDGSAESRRAAHEVLHFYAPLASRVGIWQLKWVLEDYAFRCLQPHDYQDIASQFKERRSQREELVDKIQADLRWRLNEVGITAEILGRAKNVYGIFRKMREKNLAFSDVHDVLAVRVIVDSVPECYQVLGVVHTSWPYMADEFDDYIAIPKSNGYRSLHTAVYGPQGRVLEVQIRTHEMHIESELGVCSHWDYKGENDGSLESKSIDWLREVLNWHEALNSIEPSDPISRENVDAEQVTYVSTPQRHIVDLPTGATPLDFAFKVHTDIGLHCVGALVDGEEVALNTVLKTGQTVEILTSDRATPQRQWLDLDLMYFKMSKTRAMLRSYFQEFDRTYNVDAGRDWVQQEIDRLNLRLTPEEAARALDFESPDELFVEVAMGSMKARQMLVEIAQLQHEVSERIPSDSGTKITVQIHVSAQDRKNLIRDITREIAELNVNVVNLKLGAPALGEEAKVDIWMQVSGLDEASLVIVSLRRLHRVADVRLVNSS